MEWINEVQLPDGHRIFQSGNDLKWAIADESGRYPEDTDDGVLWVDVTRPLEVETYSDPEPHGTSIYIPLRTHKGEPTKTITDTATLFVLARMLHMRIQSGSETYTVN